MGSHGVPRDPTWGVAGSRGIPRESARNFPREPPMGAHRVPWDAAEIPPLVPRIFDLENSGAQRPRVCPQTHQPSRPLVRVRVSVVGAVAALNRSRETKPQSFSESSWKLHGNSWKVAACRGFPWEPPRELPWRPVALVGGFPMGFLAGSPVVANPAGSQLRVRGNLWETAGTRCTAEHAGSHLAPRGGYPAGSQVRIRGNPWETAGTR